MYFDSALNINGASAGILFITLTKDKLRYVIRIHFLASNNTAEFEACLHGLRIKEKKKERVIYKAPPVMCECGVKSNYGLVPWELR